MKRNDLIVLGVLTAVLVVGIAMLLIQRRVPPGIEQQHITPSEAGYHGREEARNDEPHTTVYWVSIDGLRPDYLDRAHTPFFDFLRETGAYSLEHEPVFPSVTFPSHVSQATGVTVRQHGIPANRFYDLETGELHSYPGDSRLLEAEPIWTTAVRQGLRVASLGWVLAHGQTGDHVADFFDPEFPRGLPNEERLGRLLDLWRGDEDPGDPLRLLMGYAVGPDSPGHRHGPESDEVIAAVEEIDAILGRHYEEIVALWNERRSPPDAFYFVLTSDHGMSEVHTLVHPGRLTGLEDSDDAILVSVGPVLNLYLDRALPSDERERVLRQTLTRLEDYDFVRAHPREELPPEWGYAHPTRTGDLVVTLPPGYTFSGKPEGITLSAEEGDGPFGMHGYAPADDPNMTTVAFFHRHPAPLGGTDLGPIDSLQLHPTVARLLGISPAPGTTGEPIEFNDIK